MNMAIVIQNMEFDMKYFPLVMVYLNGVGLIASIVWSLGYLGLICATCMLIWIVQYLEMRN
jgi:hypothetical protein